MTARGALLLSGSETAARLLAAQVLACVTLSCVVAVSGGCSRINIRGAKPNAPAPTTLVVADPVDHLDVLAREPMIVEHPHGTLFVSGYDEFLNVYFNIALHRLEECSPLNSFNLISFYPSASPEDAILLVIQTYNDEGQSRV